LKLTITKMKENFDTLVPNTKLTSCFLNSQDETEVKIILVDEKRQPAYELCINEMRFVPGKVYLMHFGLAGLVQEYLAKNNKGD
jgi:hypothetical protein